MAVASPIPLKFDDPNGFAHVQAPHPFVGLAAHNTPLPDHARLLHVTSHFPGGGPAGTRLTVEMRFTSPTSRRLRLRIGPSMLITEVRQRNLHDGYTLSAIIPPPRTEEALLGHPLPLIVEAVDTQDHVVDWVLFGDYAYTPGYIAPSLASAVAFVPMPRAHFRRACTEDDAYGPLKCARTGFARTPSPRTPDLSPGSSPSWPATPITPRRVQRFDSRRTPRTSPTKRPAFASPGGRRPAVRVMSALEDFAVDFDDYERATGRRLVRFTRVVDAHEVRVSAAAISQAAFNESEFEPDSDSIVISCIARGAGEVPCVTSVDIIQLLEMVAGRTFEVEEKNRIRRNLEGLKPTTVAKLRPGCEAFFTRIMEYPRPKPRHIEKDIKVFDWTSLLAALDKIISKKTLFVIDISVSRVHTPGSAAAATSSLQFTGSVKSEPADISPPEFAGLVKCEPTDLSPAHFPQLSPAVEEPPHSPQPSPFFGAPSTEAVSPILGSYLHHSEYTLGAPTGPTPFDMQQWRLVDTALTWPSSQPIFDSAGFIASDHSQPEDEKYVALDL